MSRHAGGGQDRGGMQQSTERMDIVRTVIVGNLWGRNFGDDLMLRGLAAQLPRGELKILCQQNADVLRESGMSAEPFSLMRYWRAIQRADRVVIPGGTHLQFLADTPSGRQYRLLAAFLVLAVLARAAGARSDMEAIGIGPLETRMSRLLARWICQLQNSISVRDKVTRDLVSDCGRTATLVEDLALPFLRQWRSEHPVVASPDTDSYVVAAPAFARYDTQWWVDNLSELTAATGVHRIVFLASGKQKGGSDIDAINTIARHLNRAGLRLGQTHVYHGDTDAALHFIDKAAAIAAARYHVVLASRALGKHVVAEAYHPKVLDAMKVEPID
ncbi:polysaccharide pyruvyl transferase family protein [Mycolicibacterium holsaticum]|uniref:polysaccharide pyruvyl transferase family protein n=1 Tax=Mycolicibacterium holsaticum TaxID=152142 RepID=UPI001C7DBAC2|nr:polysaccharide pyruvyl transferase family protein [Mycolicibacterium holsaticum]QZA11798.1 polysaccharide pyruvyl transferase family protein [Mycolicibacterium holsaticum DSM 44478 = JCM 12374]UNC10714.1 polysaccharide pyruvyl transferase family protein [Mycolicibacterium holsaticum DSM 44478 = JCM 12374]